VKPEVVGVLEPRKVLTLPMSAEHRATLEHALRWIENSDVYKTIERNLDTIVRLPRNCMQERTLTTLFDVRKMGLLSSDEDIVSWCNMYEVEEERQEGDRIRPLAEPLINDIIKAHAHTETASQLHSSTKYTSKDVTRRGVLHNDAGCQFDYAAWFDQIPLEESIRKYFGVSKHIALFVLPMGFCPSCEVAEALTEAIADTTIPVTTSTCVDNVLFQGTSTNLQAAGEIFLQRCSAVGAVVKSPTILITESYDYCGEHYSHSTKTRCLTAKTARKCQYAASILANNKVVTLRQLMAIIGLGLYAANTLRIAVGTYHNAMRCYARAAAHCSTGLSLDKPFALPPGSRRELQMWLQRAAHNVPVPVFIDGEPEYTIYTDASAAGWGALCINKDGTMKTISCRWTTSALVGGNVQSSVYTEPLAARLAIAKFVPKGTKKVLVFTDHLPLVYSTKKTFGRAESYSQLSAFLEAYGADFVFEHISGLINPADCLSRHVGEPPILEVTKIGERDVRGLIMGVVDGQGWAFG
jgi:hypothetical protein